MTLILYKYISKKFLTSIFIIFIALISITLLFDALETLRKAHNKDVPAAIILQMLFLKLPSLLLEMMPFIILIATISTYHILTRNLELIVARSAGISAWQFLTPAIIISFLSGVIILLIINPLSALMLSKYEDLENKYFNNNVSRLSISSTGLWLKQVSADNNSKTIIHALKASQKDAELLDVTIFQFSENNQFNQRLYAKSAILEPGVWKLKDVKIITPDNPFSTQVSDYEIPTNFKLEQIQSSFASPETISFWQLPPFIKTLQEAGLPTTEHELQWHRLLVIPLLLSSTVYFAAAFALRMPRRGRTGILITAGIMVGFVLHILNQLIAAIGLSGSISLMLAAWAPIIITILFGTVLMLHLEDG